MERWVLNDEQWNRLKDLLPGKPSDPGVTARDNRRFVEAVLWIGRTGSPWRDLPPAFGSWHTTFTRFARWTKTGVWERVFRAVSTERDVEEVMLDSTAARAHHPAAGARKKTAHRLWVVLAGASAQKSMRSSMPSATRSGSRSPARISPTSPRRRR